MVEYTIAVCNYNMAKTVERSLRSILDQVDKRFEVLVIDDGSTDDSIDILSGLEEEYSNLRLIISDNNNIGEARQEAVSRARGSYILPQLDSDDIYEDVILDFVTIYHQIESEVDKKFFLKGRSLNMAPKDLLMYIPYRSLGYGEDKDLWRRLFAEEAIIWLDHDSPCHTIGYNRNLSGRIKVTYETTTVQFRSGISFPSFLSYCLQNPSLRSFVQFLMAPFAYLSAVRAQRFKIPNGFEKMGRLEKEIERNSKSIEEIEKFYGIRIDRNKLSNKGKRTFFSKPI